MAPLVEKNSAKIAIIVRCVLDDLLKKKTHAFTSIHEARGYVHMTSALRGREGVG